ncbi:MAG: DUF5640 domain-containing protein [Defluviitaleaceae bacterium]|nr:DUF5640 domain-containing protein [Defluviitaleaceae bacterium]
MKKFIMVFVLMGMVIGLVACGGSGDYVQTGNGFAAHASSPTPTPAAPTPPTPTPTPAAETTPTTELTPEPTPETEPPQSALIGRWRSNANNIVLEFSDDGTGLDIWNNEESEFTWSVENGRLSLFIHQEEHIADYAISGDGTALTLFDERGVAEVFIRLGSSPMAHATTPAPEQTPASIPEPTPSPPTTARINIQELLGADFEPNRHLFGNLIGTSGLFDPDIHIVYEFDSGIIITNQSGMSTISINFLQTPDLTQFHFDGIDGTSARHDLVATLGEPLSRNSHDSGHVWYLYDCYDFGVGTQGLGRAVFFTFNAENRLTNIYAHIHFF